LPCALTGCGKEPSAASSSDIEKTTEAPKELTLPISSDEALKKNYEDLYYLFRDAGFKNADYDGLNDLTVSSDKLNGVTASVTVNGSESFQKGDKMMSDAKIVIVYYTKSAQPATKTAPKTDSKTESKSESKPESKSIADTGVVTPSFKEMMDSYEAFFDEYVAFMKKYKENPSDLELLGEYADNMSKYSDYLAKLSAVEQDDLSAADLAYYTEVYARIMKKMAEV